MREGNDQEACADGLLPLSVGLTLIHRSRDGELSARSGPAALPSICRIALLIVGMHRVSVCPMIAAVCHGSAAACSALRSTPAACFQRGGGRRTPGALSERPDKARGHYLSHTTRIASGAVSLVKAATNQEEWPPYAFTGRSVTEGCSFLLC